MRFGEFGVTSLGKQLPVARTLINEFPLMAQTASVARGMGS